MHLQINGVGWKQELRTQEPLPVGVHERSAGKMKLRKRDVLAQ